LSEVSRINKLTIKELQKLIEQKQSLSLISPEQNKLFELLRNKPFWISDIEQHKLEHRRTNGDCCFNHIIGLPIKPSTNEAKPIFPYESDLINLLSNKKRLAILKAAGLGISECITIRWLIWKCVVNDDWRNGQAVVINSPRIQQSIDIVTRMKKLFANHGIYFDSKSTILESVMTLTIA
jgi:hypothetical protein